MGLATGVMNETLSYIRMRRQFGQAISSFQAIQHMMANCATQIEMSRALLYTTANAMDKYMLPVYKKAIDENVIVYDVLQAGDGKRWTKESAMRSEEHRLNSSHAIPSRMPSSA